MPADTIGGVNERPGVVLRAGQKREGVLASESIAGKDAVGAGFNGPGHGGIPDALARRGRLSKKERARQALRRATAQRSR
jgi:hypothetical protein